MKDERKHEVATMKNTALAPVEDNPFKDYADAGQGGNITGTLLKFAKGDYLAGAHSRAIAVGSRFIANMHSLSIGWIRWSNGKPADTRMGRVVDHFKPAWRNDLGDNDSALWEVDDNGVPKDCWQFTNTLEMADPETRELFTFSTSSKGGRKCLGRLCQTYGDERDRHPDEWPIIELGINSYQHSNKAYGRIKDPVFTIVGWIPKDADAPASAPMPAPKPAPAMVVAPLSDEPLPYETGDPDYDPPF
jgi:hypothetical protein